jgi:hypothetical protein
VTVPGFGELEDSPKSAGKAAAPAAGGIIFTRALSAARPTSRVKVTEKATEGQEGG